MADLFVLTPWFPNHRAGWPARFISDSALALAEAGHRVSVDVLRAWLPPGGSRWAKGEHAGSIDIGLFPELQRISCARYPTLPGGWLRVWTNASLDAAVSQLVHAQIARRRPDAIIVHTEMLVPAVVDAVRECGIPILAVLHGENTNQSYLAGPGQKERFRRALSRVDRLVIVGEPLREYATRLAGRGDHIVVVHNGVHAPDAVRQVPTPDDGVLRLLTVANLQDGKGVDLLLSALTRIEQAGFSRWRLCIIGTGPLERDLRQQAAAGGIAERVEFLGPMSNEDVFSHMVENDVFVLPSWREAFGVAYLEAMSSGLLAIGVRGQGPSQFIEDGVNGMLVPPLDIGALEERLTTLITGDRSAWRAIAARGNEHVRAALTWESHARHLGRLIQQVTGLECMP